MHQSSCRGLLASPIPVAPRARALQETAGAASRRIQAMHDTKRHERIRDSPWVPESA